MIVVFMADVMLSSVRGEVAGAAKAGTVIRDVRKRRQPRLMERMESMLLSHELFDERLVLLKVSFGELQSSRSQCS